MKRTKKLLAFLLAFALVFGSLPSGTVTVSAETGSETAQAEENATSTEDASISEEASADEENNAEVPAEAEVPEADADEASANEESVDEESAETDADASGTEAVSATDADLSAVLEESADGVTAEATGDGQADEEISEVAADEGNDVQPAGSDTDAESAEEEVEETEESEEPLVLETTQDGVTVLVSGSAEALAGVDSVSVVELSDERIAAYEEAFAEDDSITVSKVIAAYDITLLDAGGNAVEPDGPVSVSIVSKALQECMEEGEDIQIFHDMNTTVEAVEDDTIDNETVSTDALEVMNVESDNLEVNFTTDAFSTYVVTVTGQGSNLNEFPSDGVLADDTTYTLSSDVTLDTNLTVLQDRTVTIDLNGKTLTGNGTGSVITVNGTLTITDGSTEANGKITGGNASVSEFFGDYNGGGILINSGGSVTLEKGCISGNKAWNGGGVYIGENASFIMTGGEVSGNTSVRTNSGGGGGVYVYTNAFFMISGDAAIKNNIAGFQGGAIFIKDGTVTMNGGEISGNTAPLSGGVCVAGTFTMNGGSITGNTATVPSGIDSVVTEVGGGAVRIAYGGTFYLNGGSITGNVSTSATSQGILVSAYGAGVDCNSGGVLSISGTPTVSDNLADGVSSNIYLRGSTYITPSAEIGSGAVLYVSRSSKTGRVTDNSSSYTIANSALKADDSSLDVEYRESEVYLIEAVQAEDAVASVEIEGITTYYSSLGGAFADLSSGAECTIKILKESIALDSQVGVMSGTKVTLTTDLSEVTITWPGVSGDYYFNIPSGAELTITGNIVIEGEYEGESDGDAEAQAFRVSGTLNLGEANSSSEYPIIRYFNTSSGSSGFAAVYILSGGALNMYSGTLTENTGYYGGAVYATGATVNLYGGTICNNTAAYRGGGIVIESGTAFTMYGGEITANTSATTGGGIFARNSSSITVQDGVISGNTAMTNGGGIQLTGDTSVANGSVLTLNGGEISNNAASQYGGGVYINNGSVIMTAGNITGNSAGTDGGGIYLGNNFSVDAFLTIQGTPVIRKNTAAGSENNVFLRNGNYITLSSELTSGAFVGVTLDSVISLTNSIPAKITKGETSTTYYMNSAQYISPDVKTKTTTYGDRTVVSESYDDGKYVRFSLKENVYYVILDLENASIADSSSVQTIETLVNSGDNYSVNLQADEGYTMPDTLSAFSGLYTVDDDSIATLSLNSVSETSTISVVAVPNSYTVTFYANGGSGTMTAQNMTYDSAASLRQNTFTRTGYTFLGWATTADATAADYLDEETVLNLTAENNGNVDLYCVWQGTIEEKYISLDTTALIYNGSAQKPDVTVIYEGDVLEEGQDYVLTYSNNINAGTASVTIEGIEHYSGTVTLDFTIDKAKQSISYDISSVSKTIGDASFTNPLTVGTVDGTITYTSSEESVATVDSTGLVTLTGTAGVAVITATVAETANYTTVSASYVIGVSTEIATATLTSKTDGVMLVTVEISDEEAAKLDELTEDGGNFASYFSGMSKAYVEVQLISTVDTAGGVSMGDAIHDTEVSFTLDYPTETGITADNYSNYEIVVLHQAILNGLPGDYTYGDASMLDVTPTANGIVISGTTLSPFAIGYKLVATTNNNSSSNSAGTESNTGSTSGTGSSSGSGSSSSSSSTVSSSEDSDTSDTSVESSEETVEAVATVEPSAASGAQTGDTANLNLFLVLAAVCEAALIVMIALEERKRRKRI